MNDINLSLIELFIQATVVVQSVLLLSEKAATP